VAISPSPLQYDNGEWHHLCAVGTASGCVFIYWIVDRRMGGNHQAAKTTAADTSCTFKLAKFVQVQHNGKRAGENMAEGITDIRFAPDCTMVAIANSSNWIDVYKVRARRTPKQTPSTPSVEGGGRSCRQCRV
jgi:hypothetical protein